MPEDEEEDDDEEPSVEAFAVRGRGEGGGGAARGAPSSKLQDHVLSVAPTDEVREHRRYVLNMPSKDSLGAIGYSAKRPQMPLQT